MPPNAISVVWRSAATFGSDRVARRQPSCEASRHPVSGWAWSPSPGSKTCFLELPLIRLTALLSFCHTTGNQFLPDNRTRSCKTLNSPGVAAPWEHPFPDSPVNTPRRDRWITGPFRLQPTSSFEAGLQPKVTTPDLRSEVPRSGTQNYARDLTQRLVMVIVGRLH